ncbi:SURF1 family protein [Paracoccus sp. (in: a-proteobacteria)]|uniref:SURF1 family protein n=1 Tax=Paracoccus sp. TaxID=267 RepID=UPI0026DFF30F|nr:SURF1 family protein [Paracoccus sp. (in: a-proteobacteria)]MDO5647911.1 SURF1 family protein [Paracoccus sp. (in: a-proteobacteria)]
MRRIIFPALFGILGCVFLVSLGLWQLDRADQKQAQLTEIQTGIDAAPVPLPAQIDPSMKYLPVRVTGTTTGAEIDVLSHIREQGAGYQVISRFVTDDGRAILLDRGFVPQQARRLERPPVALQVIGNLHWPQDANSSTPAPNLNENIWFARDVDAMAAQLDTLPVLVVARQIAGDNQGAQPIPVSIDGIPNNHLSYAIQWFLFAITLAVMTVALIWRIRQQKY